MLPIGIAISGKATAGKDTIALEIQQLLQRAGRGGKIMKLATPIYDEAYLLGMSRDPDEKDRELLQRIGDERTDADPAYYPRVLWSDIRGHLDFLKVLNMPTVTYLVTDLRKLVEAEYLRQVGFAIVRLDVSPEVQTQRILELYGEEGLERLSHWTETDLDHYTKWDVKLPNNGHMTPAAVAWVIATSLGFNVGD